LKIKCRPEDFRVEEQPIVEPGENGPFVFYRLTKRGLGTPEALEAIRRRWNLAADRLHYGGLKDRHALTIQYLTISRGPEKPLRQTHLELEPLGRLERSYGPKSFRGNRFEIVARDLQPSRAKAIQADLDDLAVAGVPNYFDDQRFGSVGESGDFIAAAWIRGDYERALWLAIAEPNRADRPNDKRRKAILRNHWGDWNAAKERLDRSHARSLVTYLCDHPSDFRGAYARLRRDLRTIHVSAFQSHLWNLILARLIEQTTRADQCVPVHFRVAELPFPRALKAEQAARLADLMVPLPSARNRLGTDAVSETAQAVVEAQGLAWERLRIRHLKDVFLSKGVRPAMIRPEAWSSSIEEDALHPGRRALRLAFELPRGAYATLIIKRLTHADEPEAPGR